MKKCLIFLILAGLLSGCPGGNEDFSPLKIYGLRTDYLINPMGIESVTPGFSWKLDAEERGKYQSACQILVATSPAILDNNEGDVWDSGKIRGGESVQIDYHGKSFESGERYFWKVRVWDEKDQQSLFSEIAWFETGKFDRTDWKADWISHQPDSAGFPVLRPAPYFRKEFSVNKKLARARLYISGLGYYKAYINGEKVGDHELDPAFTRYDRRVKYVVYDILHLLTTGKNCIGVVLGNGWYNQHTRSAWDLDSADWRDDPSLIAEMALTFEDGSEQIVVSDGNWKTGHGPIVFDGIRNGEHYDARRDIPGWNELGFDDRDWKNAPVVRGPAGKLSAQLLPPIRKIRTLKPAHITEPVKGIYVLDFGENITGWVKLSIDGEEGQLIVLHYGERLHPDGKLDQKELARFIRTGETQTDRYICRGDGVEQWEPSFVYHGFQYVQIEGLEKPPVADQFTAEVLHTDLEPAGSFRSSNEMFNRIHENILNSFLGNYHGYPTDCPHREKIGWSGDAQLVSMTALYNFEMIPAYLKWIDDFADEQRVDGKVSAIVPTGGWGYSFGRAGNREHGYGPHWDGAYLNIPWDMYQFTGDPEIPERYYDGFKDYMSYLERSSDDYILDYGIDDHKPVTTVTEGDILSTAYFYDFARKMEKIASLTGRVEDEVHYEELAGKIFNAFNRRFYNTETGLYGNGGQTSLAMVLYLGLVPDDLRPEVISSLLDEIEDKDYHIDAGVVGTRFMIKALTELDFPGIMYSIATQPDYPGWGYWIEKGATTLWQTWEGDMSLNHIMFGSIGEWFYHSLGGIRPDPEDPGFRHFILKPEPVDSLDWVESSFESVYGKILSNWKNTGEAFDWEIKVPVNTIARVHIPNRPDGVILESGKEIGENENFRIVEKTNSQLIIEVPSGVYNFRVE